VNIEQQGVDENGNVIVFNQFDEETGEWTLGNGVNASEM